jgi:copper(I)-binding protein
MKKILTALVLSLVTLPTVSYGTIQIGQLKIDHCWIRPAQMGGNTAAYLIINNDKLLEDKLLSAECTVANRIELHNHIHENGVMKMRPVAHVDIRDKQTEMKPGGLHIMLMDLKQELKENDKVTMKLTFEKAGSVNIEFDVKKPA